MGVIHLENMEFYAYHGHYKEEQIVGNKFLVDLLIETDMSKPARSDDQKAYKLVKEEMSKKSHLLEHIGKRILDILFREFNGIKRLTVKVAKMNPPIGGKMDSVSVTLTREHES